MYVRFIVARRALPCAARASWTSGIQAEPAAPASSKCYTRQYATQPSSKATTTCTSMLSSITSCSSASGTLAVALAAMFACLSTSKDDASVCEREKILWVEAYGKKVAVHEKDVEPPDETSQSRIPQPKRKYYPYVILGYGVAGQAALRAILERDPGAKVLVVDPRKDAALVVDSAGPELGPAGAGSGAIAKARGVDFAAGVKATALDADRGLVTLSPSSNRRPTAAMEEEALSDRGNGRAVASKEGSGAAVREEVKFGRCLLALGSKPRLPPPGFVDPSAWQDVSLLGSREWVNREELKRDISAGKAVTIVGSSWEALELACWLREERGRFNSSGKKTRGRCRMVFPDYAPLDHVLPRYLSIALLRRLKKNNIKTIGHSSLRWVGRASAPELFPPPPPSSAAPNPQSPGASTPEEGPRSLNFARGKTSSDGGEEGERKEGAEQSAALPFTTSEERDAEGKFQKRLELGPAAAAAAIAAATETKPETRRQRLQVMTAHSFDHLDTALHSADRVVLAGVDVAPLQVTLDLHGKEESGSNNQGESGAVARRKKAGTLEVDSRRGAVVVNAELAASSRVWAAGDVACFPSQADGGRRVVLRSVDHAHHSGRIAGENMAAAAGALLLQEGSQEQFVGTRKYCHTPAFVGEAPLVGVRLAMIGNCDAALPTQGFWWTNNATGLKSKGTALGRRTTTKQRGLEDEGTQPRGVTLRSRKTVRKDFTPVFGTGVIFYTSGAEVTGAMLWGFPGETTAAASMGVTSSSLDADQKQEETPADAAAGISARALDLLRKVMERSANMEADLSDERVLHAWMQGLSEAAKVVAQETGLGHMQPMRRSVPGRVTSSTRRPPGTRDELMYQNTAKTSSAQRRLRAAYAARIRGVSPQPYPNYSSGTDEGAEFDPELMEFLGYGGKDVFDGGGAGSSEE